MKTKIIILTALFIIPLATVAIVFRHQIISVGQCPATIIKETTELSCTISQTQNDQDIEAVEQRVVVKSKATTKPALPVIEPNEIEALVNEARVANGLKELQPYDCLRQAAETRAQEAMELFEHRRPDGSAYNTLVFPCSQASPTEKTKLSVGENLATGFFQPELIIPAWLNSPSHRDVLLSDKYNYIGIGIYEGYIAMEVCN